MARIAIAEQANVVVKLARRYRAGAGFLHLRRTRRPDALVEIGCRDHDAVGVGGELIVGETPRVDPGYRVARGPVATVEIGVEVKILAKAMIKQIDRVKSDLVNQVRNFRRRSGSSNPICVGIVGINYAQVTTSYEGDRSYRTDGGLYKHPVQEAEPARGRLASVAPEYDEFLILKYSATNEPPYPFAWVNQRESVLEYGAALIRISNEYQRRF
jgi:hypothetical protein